jgi:probable HAF family extracellular repeat protein
MRDKTRLFLLVWGGLALLRGFHAHAGECRNAEFCKDPCPAENSCPGGDRDCPEGMWCVPSCLPSVCICDAQRDTWSCTFDCAGECVERPVWTGPPEYLIIQLGTLGGWVSVGLGVNDCGQVVGGADTREGLRHAFLWDSGQMIDLGNLPGLRHSEAWDVNNNAQAVGLSVDYYGGAERGFLWDNGEMIDLGDHGGGRSSAKGINDTGEVVGHSYVSGTEYHPFLWEHGRMSDLRILGFPAGIPWDISDSGHVVGGRYLWDSAAATDLGTLGGDLSYAAGVNELDQVVGRSERVAGSRFFHAFLWDNGEMIDLGEIGGFFGSEAAAINNHGEVVGSPHFLYDPDKGMQDLFTLISPYSDWRLLHARDINDAGQIVGQGSFQGVTRAFLMTPLDADFDDDEDTDLVDFAAFAACLSGPGTPVEDQCKPYDLDRNGASDLVDFQAFQWVFDGP